MLHPLRVALSPTSPTIDRKKSDNKNGINCQRLQNLPYDSIVCVKHSGVQFALEIALPYSCDVRVDETRNLVTMTADPRKLSVIGAGLPYLRAVSTSGSDGSRAPLQYRRAKTAAANEIHVDRHGRKSAPSEPRHVRRSAVSLSACEIRDPSNRRFSASSQPEDGRNRDSTSSVDISIAHRTLEERLANPDRLSLDRRGLTVCPRLEGEENLRLLNLQHNAISLLRNLNVLRKLIFLDLYDNRIERISGLGSLRLLRVLMLGKNRITQIDGLESLDKLDVLDLHGNEIEEISNLSHLTELRVLNLAGNRIREVRGLLGMRSLTELNLRRNHIVFVDDVDRLPHLERIFLSHNEITNWVQIDSLARSDSICELTLDGNTIAREKQYRLAAIHHMPNIRCLDMKRVSDEERRLALAWSRREEEKKKELGRIASLKERRRQALCQAKKQWEMSHSSLWNRTGRVMRIPDLYSMHLSRPSPGAYVDDPDQTADEAVSAPAIQPLIDPSSASVIPPALWDRTHARTTVESVFADLNKISESSSQKQQTTIVNTTDSGFDSSIKTNHSSEIEFDEVDGAFPNEDIDDSVQSPSEPTLHVAEVIGTDLILYGPGAFPALEGLYVKDIANTITSIIFKYIEFDDVIANLPKLRFKYPSVTSLTFASNNISSFPQLGLLSQIRRIDNITIDEAGNPVTKMQYWRYFLMMRMAHANIRKVNGQEVSESEWEIARSLFQSVITSDSRKGGDGENSSNREDQVQRASSSTAHHWAETCLRTDSNRVILGAMWPRIWRTLVLNAVDSIANGQREKLDLET